MRLELLPAYRTYFVHTKKKQISQIYHQNLMINTYLKKSIIHPLAVGHILTYICEINFQHSHPHPQPYKPKCKIHIWLLENITQLKFTYKSNMNNIFSKEYLDLLFVFLVYKQPTSHRSTTTRTTAPATTVTSTTTIIPETWISGINK